MNEPISPETDSFRNQNPRETKGASLHEVVRGSPPKQQELKGTGGMMATGKTNPNTENILKIVVASLVAGILSYGLGRMDTLASAPWLAEKEAVYAQIDSVRRLALVNEKRLEAISELLSSINRIDNRVTRVETIMDSLAAREGLSVPPKIRPRSNE
jgi:hypothetical protein